MLVEGPSLVTGAPFSGVVDVQSVTTFADGNRIVRTNTVRYFRDGQGRTRTERQGLSAQGIAPPGGGVSSQRRHSPVCIAWVRDGDWRQ